MAFTRAHAAPGAGALHDDLAYVRELERRYPIVFGVPLDLQQVLGNEP